ncbi:hypothetical protein [uncultured Polaribacter sp.]|uniref:hypothetical protein n=1 Tax=uncultured Polaribacter sp. TaxID=174711 RepID=UPI00260D639B|nr:hypothetical protein [uncultured Polaribacter sp.]
MKKIILFLVFTISISGTLFAQKNIDKKVNAFVKTIESKTTLTSKEKTKILELKKEHLISIAQVTKDFKGKPEFKEKRKESNKKFSAALVEAFGKERAKEVMKAAKKKKGKKNKKKKKKKN